VEPPSDVSAQEGETAEFICRLTPCMPPPSVTWYFEPIAHGGNRKEVVGGDRYQLSVSGEGVASLVVSDVRQSDAGIYTMCAASVAGPVEVSAMLTVRG